MRSTSRGAMGGLKARALVMVMCGVPDRRRVGVLRVKLVWPSALTLSSQYRLQGTHSKALDSIHQHSPVSGRVGLTRIVHMRTTKAEVRDCKG